MCVQQTFLPLQTIIFNKNRHSTEVTQILFFFIEFIYICIHFYPFKHKIHINGSVYIVSINYRNPNIFST